MTQGRRWNLIPQFLLRRAGFAFSSLEPLRAREAMGAASAVVGARAAAREARRSLLELHFPAEVRRLAEGGLRGELRQLSRWRRRVGHLQPHEAPAGPWAPVLLGAFERWREALGREARAREALEHALEAEVLASRQALRRFFAQGPVREALFLLAPDLLDAREPLLDRPVRAEADAAERALERRLYAFAQRLSAKNETTSFFGPLSYGEVSGEGEGFKLGQEVPAGVVKREAFLAFWAAAALARVASADSGLRAALPVRRLPVSSVSSRGEAHEAAGPDGRKTALSLLQARLFHAANDARDVGALARVCEVAPEQAEAEVVKLERLGLVRRQLEPRSTTARPLEDLLGQLPDVAASGVWRERFSTFRGLLHRFEQAGLAERRRLLREAEALFTGITGESAKRAAGETYADRSILYEDCLGDAQPLRMATAEARRIEEGIAPALDLAAAYGSLRHRAVRALAQEVLSTLAAPLPFLAFAAALDARIAAGALAPFDAPGRAFLARLGQLVAQASDGRCARLTREALEPFLAGGEGGRFASPDVMLALEPSGPPKFVLGEVHPYVFAWGSQGHFAPDPERFLAPFRADLSPWGGAERLAMVLRRRRHKGLVSDAFPGTFIEISGRSVDAAERRIAIADLHVHPGPEGPELVGPRGALTLYSGEDDHPHLRVFAPPGVELPPVRLGLHTPRIEVGACVLQRERWDLPAGSLEALEGARRPGALAIEVAAAREAHGWPRWLFAWSPSEVKPLCLDLESPLAHSHLQRLSSLGRVALTEMLPSPDSLWLRRAAGAHTSELRLALVRDA